NWFSCWRSASRSRFIPAASSGPWSGAEKRGSGRRVGQPAYFRQRHDRGLRSAARPGHRRRPGADHSPRPGPVLALRSGSLDDRLAPAGGCLVEPTAWPLVRAAGDHFSARSGAGGRANRDGPELAEEVSAVNIEQHQKGTAGHLKREAYLYVRQSTLRQVFENTESTKRQYALKERAVALGWALDRGVVVIDTDLGQSGAASDREGFQKLVAAVGMGQVGIVLGLEVSRLARNSAEWHRLLEICALTETLILDEDGLYDPGHFNDRLLLGLKGTMSEAELHVLRARLQGGIRAKARRGELKTPLPVGLAYNLQEQVVLDPDQQVQQAMRLFFDTFRHTGSASATVRSFREQGLLFP